LNNMFKNLAIWMVIGLVLMTVFNQFSTRQVTRNSIEYSQFLDEVRQGHISKVLIEGRTLKGTTTEGKQITSYAPPDLWMVSDLLKNGVKIEAKPEEEPSFLMNIFVSWFPMLLLIGVWVFFMRQMQGGGKGGAFSFGKSRARMTDEAQNTVTFADVAGCDEAKEEVQELVDFLRDPSKFQKLGGHVPKGGADGRQPGHRQDIARQGHRRRGQGGVLQHFRFRFRRNVRRCRRRARSRHVRERQEACAVHHLHR
jgi:cell division protease FtsH